MATLIVMPKLSPTMEEGVLLKWTRREGDRISPGEVIAEVETDKANMEFPLEDEGTLLKLLVKEGETVKLGAPVAVLGEPGEDVEAALAGAGVVAVGVGEAGEQARPATETAPGKGPGAEAKAAPGPAPSDVLTAAATAAEPGPGSEQANVSPPQVNIAPQETDVALQQKHDGAQRLDSATQPPAGAAQPGAPTEARGYGGVMPGGMPARPSDVAAHYGDIAPQQTTPDRRIKASPLARKVATARGVPIAEVPGSGPGGRVVVRDVEGWRAPAAKAPAPRPEPIAPAPKPAAPIAPSAPAPIAPSAPAPIAPAIAGVAGRGDQSIPLTQMRKTVARRLTEAKATVPHFYLTIDVDAEALWRFYEEARASLARADVKLTVNDLVVKAAAAALVRVPDANASFGEGAIVRHGRVDVGIAVALDGGLITPVVRDADLKTLGQIARDTRDLVARARDKRLRPEEFTGATFSVSNLGMYGIREFAAIINPPEGAILAVGALEKRAVVVTTPDGRDELAIRRAMTLTLSCDHRVVDGALGAQLLGQIKRLLEEPLAMVL